MSYLATCTAGDEVPLPTLTLGVAEGHSLDGATIRVAIWLGSQAAPAWVLSKGTGDEGLTFTPETGELVITLGASDWPEAALTATNDVQAQIEVEVSLASGRGPFTVLRDRRIMIHPQMIGRTA